MNGQHGALLYVDGVLDTVATVEVVGDRISRIYLMRNPDKLGAVAGRLSVGR